MVERTIVPSNIVSEHKIVKVLVEEILSEDDRAKNSDLWLILQFWQKKQHIKIFVPYDKLSEMVSPETIRRCRQHIQNTEKKFLPTDPSVMVHRRINEEAIRKYYATQPEMVDRYKSAKKEEVV